MSSPNGARKTALFIWSSRHAAACGRSCAPSSTIWPEPSEMTTSQAEAAAKEGAPAIRVFARQRKRRCLFQAFHLSKAVIPLPARCDQVDVAPMHEPAPREGCLGRGRAHS